MSDDPQEQRLKLINARKEDLARRMPPKQRVRVNPASDDIRRDIMHYPSRIRFPESGSVEWPLDRFTQRRLLDGSVTLEGTTNNKPHHHQRHAQAS